MSKRFRPFHTVCVILLLCIFQQATAQTGTVKGLFKDADGIPLPGASITVEGKRTGTTTNDAGAYLLKLSPGRYTLIGSFAGRLAQRKEITVVENETLELNFVAEQGDDLDNIVVIGSRSREARSNLTTPVPVDVLRTQDLKPFAQMDISQMLTYSVPSFQSARQTISDGTDHIDPAGLRGLGPDQTLVLLNGKRRHTTALVNINGSVGRGSVGTDLNAIPSAAIDRIEVLRDGAAAQYGSDAIAGVINIVLKKNYNGFNISTMAGGNFTKLPYKGGININDGLNQQVDFNGGWARDKFYVNISGQWLRRERTNRSGDDNIPLVYLGNAGAFPANPYPNVNTNDYRKWLIDQDAAIVQQRGYDRHNIVAGNSYSQNFSAFVNAGARITDHIDFYLTAGASHRDGEANGFSRNPNSVAQQPVLADGTRFYADGFLPQIAPSIDDASLIAGINLEAGAWNIDLSNTIGRNSIWYTIENTGNASLPPTNQVQTTFNAGRLSFLQNTTNLDISRKYNFSNRSSLNVAAGGELRHETFQIKAGELNSYFNGKRVARVDSIQPYPGTDKGTTFDPVVPGLGAQVFPGFTPQDAVKATRNVYAVYGDLELTLKKWVFDGAGRYENYAEKGLGYDNVSGKIAARYEISNFISIRGSVSNGFRAPSLQQRYFQNTSTQFVGGFPSNSLTANNYNPIVRDAFGVNQLKPERSNSYSLGVVGKNGKGFTFTADGYFISIHDRIVLSTPFNRSNPLVNKILNDNKVDSSTAALQFWTNAVNTETKGIDIVATQRFRIAGGNASISLSANFNENKVVGDIHTNSKLDAVQNNPFAGDPAHGIPGNPAANPANDLAFTLFDRQQRGRIETAQPRSKINLTLTYNRSKWSFLLRAVRFGESEFLNNIDPASQRITDNFYFNDVGFGTDQVFSAKITTDLVVTYKICPGILLSVGGNNIFDVYPDKVFVDPRNDPQAVYANPGGPASVPSATKSTTGYNAGRDASNRGRFLFGPNQFGYNGRFLFSRLSIEPGQMKRKKNKTKR
ncbi:MAG TPA: TonB-dependent receptor [Chitinophagaceae bacterium]|nr:TonB-dependent receptor [Chitinophagaceae bacterium]